MQQPQNQNANLLSIFSFIFAGIQGLALLFIGLYALLMIGMLVAGVANARSSDAAAFIFPVVMALIFGVLAAFGIISVWLNIKLGRMLRSTSLPTPKRIIVTSIFNICSFLCGGIFVAPFGMALGIFGIVFATSDNGKAFLSGRSPGQLLPPPPPINYGDGSREMHNWR